MRVLVCPLQAVSIVNQANLIKRVIEQHGYECELRSSISANDVRDVENSAFLWFTLATSPYLGGIAYPYMYGSKPKAIYVTVEGIPTQANIRYSPIKQFEFITVSRFVKRCLQEQGLKVRDWVHHGIDFDLIARAKQLSKQIRKELNQTFRGKVKLFFTGRFDPRKGLERLAEANRILLDRGMKDYVILLQSGHEVMSIFPQSNVSFVGVFGAWDYTRTLAFMGACDYFIFPSMCEGFGLPVLEANAMGVPAIHAWMEPLDEFSSKDHNFTFDYAEIRMVRQDNLQYWVFHDYPPDWLADMIKYACEVYRNSKEEYKEYCRKAEEHAHEWDYRKTYKRLLAYLGITSLEPRHEDEPLLVRYHNLW